MAADPLSKAEVVTVKTAASRVGAATTKGDADTIIATTHASVKEAMGGTEKFEAATRTAMQQLASAGIRYLDISISDPSLPHDAGEEIVCFIPISMKVEVKGRKAKSHGFLVAIRAKAGSEWTFIDSAPLRTNPELLWSLLPKLTRDLTLPEIKVELIE